MRQYFAIILCYLASISIGLLPASQSLLSTLSKSPHPPTFLLFTHKWCFNSLIATQLFSKLKPKHPDITFLQSQDPHLAEHFNITSYPSFLMFKNLHIQPYQFNVNDEQIGYWIDIFFREKLKTPETLERLLKGKEKYVVVFPKNVNKQRVKRFVFGYPLWTVYENQTDTGLLQIINQYESTLIERFIGSQRELEEVMGKLADTHIYMDKFTHRARMQMINGGFIGITLFYRDNLDEPERELAGRFKKTAISICAYLNGNKKLKFSYDMSQTPAQNKYIFFSAPASHKITMTLLSFLNLQPQSIPMLLSFSFPNNSLVHTQFPPIDRTYVFADYFLFWVTNQKFNPQEPKQTIYQYSHCPRPHLSHRLRSNDLEAIKLNIEIQRICQYLKLGLTVDERRWHKEPGVYVCEEDRVGKLQDPLEWLREWEIKEEASKQGHLGEVIRVEIEGDKKNRPGSTLGHDQL